MTRLLFLALTTTTLVAAISLMVEPKLLSAATLDSSLLESIVGQVEHKCCKPGRRWGCDPTLFNQSGCVHIEQSFPQCSPGPQVKMKCTSAACQHAGSEDLCSIEVRTVGQNLCRPTGTKTTVGCPPDHWQCRVAMVRYDSKEAPRSDRFVCDLGSSTICPTSYSACD